MNYTIKSYRQPLTLFNVLLACVLHSSSKPMP